MPHTLRPELQKALDELNPQQRSAVEQTEGPVMVIAGPGTGKTQILAARIGRILSHPDLGDVRPDQVLCLTYTDAGAVAMRQRLLSFIGPDAYRAGIFTFHSFCNKVIQEHPERFGMRELEPISELEERQLLRQILQDLPAGHPLKRWSAAVFSDVPRLSRLFSTMKQEAWSPEFIEVCIRSYLEDLPNRDEYVYQRKYKEFQPGDLKQGKIDEQHKKMEDLLAAVQLFPVYEQAMKASGRYDYDDMIAWVRNALEQDEDLLRDYQEQYQYLLVDEYQDTNGSQNKILKSLLNYWSSPNVFVVGDDDQSIYRFQGASMENILEYHQQYRSEGLHTVLLERNYRSSQVILDAASALIAHNSGRLVGRMQADSGGMALNKNLLASNSQYADLREVPRVIRWFNTAHEVAGTARAIERMIAEGTCPSAIAVIYRKHSQAEPILTYLQALGIGVTMRRKANILDSVFVRNVLNVLDYISRESASPGSADELLFEMMHYGFTGIEASSVAKLAWDLRKLNAKQGTNLSWREYLMVLPESAPDLFSGERDAQRDRVLRFARQMEGWIGAHRNLTLQELLEQVLIAGGAVAWVLDHPQRARLMEEVQTLFAFVKAETLKKPLLDLEGLLSLFRTYREEDLRLEANRTIASAKGVNFMTAHGAKGLEFDHVFLIGCEEKSWKGRNNNNAFTMPDTLLRMNTGDDEEEGRRLFYVAMTRAHKSLCISYAERNNDDKEQNQVRYVAELQQSGFVVEEPGKLSEAAFAEYWQRFVQPAPRPSTEPDPTEQQRMREVLESFQLSVTNLNKYLKCPRSFYYETILRIPGAKNRYMSFGTAVHEALERFFRSMKADPQQNWPSDRELLGWFDRNMHRHRDSFTREHFQHDLERGRYLLPRFAAARRDHWGKTADLERNINRVLYRGIPLRGKLDRIEYSVDSCSVFDYKTGKYDASKFKPPVPGADESQPFEKRMGGDYWRQAVFYKLLVDADPNQRLPVQHAVFEFVEPDKNEQFPVHAVPITPEDLETVGAQIEQAWQGIQNLEFSRGCGEPHCRWCRFEQEGMTELGAAADADEE